MKSWGVKWGVRLRENCFKTGVFSYHAHFGGQSGGWVVKRAWHLLWATVFFSFHRSLSNFQLFQILVVKFQNVDANLGVKVGGVIFVVFWRTGLLDICLFLQMSMQIGGQWWGSRWGVIWGSFWGFVWGGWGRSRPDLKAPLGDLQITIVFFYKKWETWPRWRSRIDFGV